MLLELPRSSTCLLATPRPSSLLSTQFDASADDPAARPRVKITMPVSPRAVPQGSKKDAAVVCPLSKRRE